MLRLPLQHGRAPWQARAVTRVTSGRRIAVPTLKAFSTSASARIADGHAGTGQGHVVDVADALTVPSTENGIIGTLADAFLAIQPPGALSYAGLIVAATLALRCSVTLPVTFWQRRRIDRVQNIVTPMVQQWMAKERYALRAEYRKLNKSYDEYTEEFKKRTKTEFKRLSAIHGCASLPTLIVPPLVHLPVFITCTLVLREASLRSYRALESAATPVGDEGVLDISMAVSQAATLAMESFHWCHSLADVDRMLILPFTVCLALLANTEVQAGLRAKLAQVSALRAARNAATAMPSEAARPVTVSVRPAAVAHPALALARASAAASPNNLQKQVRKRRASTGRGVGNLETSPNPTNASAEATVVLPTLTTTSAPSSPRQDAQKTITTLLRAFSILFLPIAASAPVAVNLYWLTSNLFSVAQNTTLAYLESRKSNGQ